MSCSLLHIQHIEHTVYLCLSQTMHSRAVVRSGHVPPTWVLQPSPPGPSMPHQVNSWVVRAEHMIVVAAEIATEIVQSKWELGSRKASRLACCKDLRTSACTGGNQEVHGTEARWKTSSLPALLSTFSNHLCLRLQFVGHTAQTLLVILLSHCFVTSGT